MTASRYRGRAGGEGTSRSGRQARPYQPTSNGLSDEKVDRCDGRRPVRGGGCLCRRDEEGRCQAGGRSEEDGDEEGHEEGRQEGGEEDRGQEGGEKGGSEEVIVPA